MDTTGTPRTRARRNGEAALHPVVAELWTDVAGLIIEATPPAAAVLGVSHAHVTGRNLIPFFLENRPAVIRLLEEAARGHVSKFSARMRPRDRPAIHVEVIVERADSLYRDIVQWTVSIGRPASGPVAA